MSINQNRNRYVGHRYVPKIMNEWDKQESYEGLSIVTYQGGSYTSKKHVPVGIDILDTEYWVHTGNYNAQVEHYRQEVKDMKESVDQEVKDMKESVDKKADKEFVNESLQKAEAKIDDISINIRKYENLVEGEDWTKAIITAMEELTAGRNQGLNKSIHFPKGVYYVKPNVLSDFVPQTPTEIDPLRTGLTFTGEGGYTSILYLVNDAQAPAYFFDNGSKRRLQRINFEKLGFAGNDRRYCKGFKVTSTGGEKQFTFNDCVFGSSANAVIGEHGFNGYGLSSIMDIEGNANADLMKFFNCVINVEDYVMYNNNPEGVANDFYGCWIDTYGDVFLFGETPGGSTNMFGGGINMLPSMYGDTEDNYIVKVHDEGFHFMNNCNISFFGIRVELRTTTKKLVKALSRNSGFTTVTFNACNLGIVNNSEEREAVLISSRKKVTFNDCILSTYLLFRVTRTYNESAQPEQGGMILIENCRVGASTGKRLLDRVFIDERQGRIIARNNSIHFPESIGGGSKGFITVQDFDLGWNNMLPGEAQASKKVALFFPSQWTSFPNHADGLKEFTVKLPMGALISKIYIRKEKGTLGESDYQLNVGNNNKSIIYGSSTLAPQKNVHTIDVTLNKIIKNENDQYVRLWVTDGLSDSFNAHTGLAYVEYI